ncbi:MAG: hypothetical protein ACLU37_07680 [Collinsella sp.]
MGKKHDKKAKAAVAKASKAPRRQGHQEAPQARRQTVDPRVPAQDCRVRWRDDCPPTAPRRAVLWAPLPANITSS